MIKLIRVLLWIALWSIPFQAIGQQKPVVSQYMFNGLVLNPAYAGVHNHLDATAVYRDQWVNLEGAPSTTTFTAHSNLKGKNIGLGMMLSNDRIGVHSDNSFHLMYAYKIRTSAGTLSMGLQSGFNYLSSDYTLLNLKNEADPLLSQSLGSLKMNFGTGVYFSTPSAYIGFSVPYILKNRNINLDMAQQIQDSRYYYFTAGRVFDVSRKVKFKPSVLLRLEEGMPIAGDVNINLYLEDLVNVGFSWRSGDSFVSLFELKLNDFFRLGYAYDWIISDLSNFSSGSHEFMLNYRINMFAPRKHKMCPGPFYY
ncbi:MAG: type IX secretion system membrane protein PorP/SprF [Cyclobacteriaceae bacterium]